MIQHPVPAVLLTLIALFLADPSQAQIRRATVAVDGMACPFCAFGVEKRLRKVDGVLSVNVSSRDGLATLLAKDGASIAVASIPEAVKKAGFSPGETRIEVIGRLSVNGEGKQVLVVRGTKQHLVLSDPGENVTERLSALAERGALVELEGKFRARSGAPSTLSPERVEEATE